MDSYPAHTNMRIYPVKTLLSVHYNTITSMHNDTQQISSPSHFARSKFYICSLATPHMIQESCFWVFIEKEWYQEL